MSFFSTFRVITAHILSLSLCAEFWVSLSLQSSDSLIFSSNDFDQEFIQSIEVFGVCFIIFHVSVVPLPVKADPSISPQ